MRCAVAVVLAVLLSPGVPRPLAAQGSTPQAAAPATQGADGEIRGTVLDAASGAPLAGASVAVRRAADSTLVAGAVSRADGAFRVRGLAPGRYYLRVSRLGYATATVPVAEVTASARVADTGRVRLRAGAVALEGVSVTAERPMVTGTPDRTVVSTANMPTATGGTATDVLRNVPGVDVDADGNVSLRGNSSVVIQINGRPSPLTGDALAAFIRQLPAALIDRVEVVPNPSAKYDPDGMGGILNLVLKRTTDLGTSGGATLSAATGERYGASGNLGRQQGPLSLFGSYGFNHDERDGLALVRREEDGGGTPLLRQQRSDGLNRATAHTVSGSGDLKLGTADVLSGTVLLSHRGGANEAATAFSTLATGGQALERFTQRTAARQASLNTEYTLALAHAPQPHGNELSAEVRFNRGREDRDTRFLNLAGVPAPAELQGDTRTRLGTLRRELDAQADWTRALGGATRLETGYKGTLRRLGSGYLLDSLAAGGSGGAGTAYDFTYEERVHAAYALLTRTLGPRLTLQGGVRAERASTSFRLSGAAAATRNGYNTLFPSAALTWAVNEHDELHASYSKRIERPEAERLNPFPFVQDPFHVTVGNPLLKPEYEHAYEVSYQHSAAFGTVSVTPFFRHTVDEVKRFHVVDAQGVDTLTFRNLTSSDDYGSEFAARFRGSGPVSGMLSLSGYRNVSNGGNVQQGLGARGLTWSARANLNLRLSPSTDVQWFQYYRAARNTEQGRNGASSMANVAVRQKLGANLSLNVRVSDPFNTMRNTSLLEGEGFTESQVRRFDSRTVYLSFSSTFGHAPRLRRPPEPEQQPIPQPDNGGGG
jgi:outer membrane cobalamin receptor